MKEWIKVVTDPMGLAGFALFMVFGILAKKGKKPQWLAIGAYAMALIALTAGLALAYLRTTTTASQTHALPNAPSQVPTSPGVNQLNIGEVKQQSSGSSAVNAAGVQGQITVNNGSASPTATPSPRK